MTRFIRNVFSNWTGMAVNMAIAFFMSPFLVHNLGDRHYGLWVLILSLTGYMGLLDIGLRVSVVKYVSQFATKRDFDGLNRVVSTAISFYGGVAIVIVLLTLGLEYSITRIFTIDPRDVETARLVLLLAGVNVAATLIMSIPGGVLAGLQRYDLSSAAGIVTVLVRSVAIVAAIWDGMGIVALACIHLGSQVLFGTLAWQAARWVRPELGLSWRLASIDTGKMLWGYSAFVLLNNAGRFLLFNSGELVVGMFLGTASVTYYAIAGTIAQYMQQLVVTMAQVLHPYAAEQDAKGSSGGLRRAAIIGTRMALVVAIPITVTVIVVGYQFISLWMGPEYARIAGPLLVVLTLARLVHLSQAGAYEVLLGMSRHRVPTTMNLVAGVCGVAISMALAPRYGLTGVVIGGALPILAVHGAVLPVYATRVLGIPALAFVREALLPPVVAAVPYAAALYMAARIVPLTSLPNLALVVVGTLPVFGVAAFFTCIDRTQRIRLLQMVRGSTPAARATTEAASPVRPSAGSETGA